MAGMTAVCLFLGALAGSKIHLQQQGNKVMVTSSLTALQPGEHGFHIHEKGDLGDSCKAAGPHYNPDKVNHGYPDAQVHHKGDLGNFIVPDGTPVTAYTNHSDSYSFFNLEEVLGRAFVVHQKRDDGGLGGDEESLKTGNAGARLDCCVIKTDSPSAAVSVKHLEQMWITTATLAAATVLSARTIAS